MRKVLSLVLILALVLGCFSFVSAAETNLTDVDGNANEQAITVCYDLGIVTGNPDGTYQPAKAVNRAEFAAMITRALGIPESALASFTTTSFKDTTGYGWAVPYLAYCNSKGIMLGDGNGNAMPSRTITLNEAVTMVLRAIGYTDNSSQLVGTWPANYVTKAQDLGLYKDVQAAAGGVDKAVAAQVIYNALDIQKVQVASDGTTTQINTGAPLFNPVTMLTSGLNCAEADDTILYSTSEVINTTPYVGQYGTVYTEMSDGYYYGNGRIVAFMPKSTELTGKFIANGNFKADGVEYTIASTTQAAINAAANSGAAYAEFANMAKSGVAAPTVFTKADTATEFTINVKLIGKTISELYSAQTWTITADAKATADVQSDVKDATLLGYKFTKKDGAIDDNSFTLVGVNSLADIAKDNVVYVYTGGTSNNIVKVAVGTEIVEGAMTAWDATNAKATINGKTYSNSAAAGATPVGATQVSKTVKANLDAYNKIYSFSAVGGTADKYAVAKTVATTSGFDKLIKLYTLDGEGTYTLKSEVATTGAVVNGLVAYSLDKNGKIDAITSMAEDGANFVTSGALTLTSKTVLKDGAASLVVNSDVVVFTLDNTTVKVSTIDNVKLNTAFVGQYALKSGKVAAMVVTADVATKSDTSIYAVVDSATLTVNADNTKVYQLKGYGNGSALDVLTNKEATTIAVNKTEVHLYKLATNTAGVVTTITDLTLVSGGSIATSGGIEISASGTGYVTATGTGINYALADGAVIYKATLNDAGTQISGYSVVSSVPKGARVWLYDKQAGKPTDTGYDQYDVVIFIK